MNSDYHGLSNRKVRRTFYCTATSLVRVDNRSPTRHCLPLQETQSSREMVLSDWSTPEKERNSPSHVPGLTCVDIWQWPIPNEIFQIGTQDISMKKVSALELWLSCPVGPARFPSAYARLGARPGRGRLGWTLGASQPRLELTFCGRFIGRTCLRVPPGRN